MNPTDDTLRLVKQLREYAEMLRSKSGWETHWSMASEMIRAADLIERLAQPGAVTVITDEHVQKVLRMLTPNAIAGVPFTLREEEMMRAALQAAFAGERVGAVRIELPKPTPDQVEYLEGIRKASEDVDLSHVVGGPKPDAVCASAIEDALANYDRAMESLGSCGDGNCVILKPKGQHTNGGCHCYEDRTRARRAMACASFLATKIRALLHQPAHKPMGEEGLADVDGLIAEYGIDTVGTGSHPTQKEQHRVNKIVEAAIKRDEERAAMRAVEDRK